MAEPLKNQFGPDVPARIADMLVAVDPTFQRDAFIERCLDGFDDLELTPRARHISDALAEFLPDDRALALRVIIDSLPEHGDAAELTGMEGFRYLPYVFFVADHGLDHFETAMTAQYELTKRFTAEFSIRAYLEHAPEATLDRLHVWARDPDVHVRRLVSEGTRPRLPWAPRLPAFQADPSPVIELLELLKDDPEEYVRRSVANNLNDISKDHPERATEVARRWWTEGDDVRRKLVRHGLRTLVKQGDPAALEILGYVADSPIQVDAVVIDPDRVAIGDKVRIEVSLTNPSDTPAGGLVDLRVHFVKANGATSPKVFKGAEVTIPPGQTTAVRKTVSIAQHSTRTHYRGFHSVDIMLNGVTHDGGSFEVL
jgi:3-methyladenine DNA glycosylase AlkC